MHIIKAGRRWLNLEKLVMAEDLEAPEDTVRVTMVAGKEFDLTGPVAARARIDLDAAVVAFEGAIAGCVVPSADPDTGEPLAPKSVAST